MGGTPAELRPKAMTAARKAIELDPELAEAHVLLADLHQQQWEWAAAEAEYGRALELKPNDASANVGFAAWLMCEGRMDEALSWAQHGRELDPLGVTGRSYRRSGCGHIVSSPSLPRSHSRAA
jgi:Tfp pilus assembly protein PilF